MNEAQPALVYEVYASVERWEKRVRLTSVRVRDVDIDKKEIAIIGFIAGSSERVEMSFTIDRTPKLNVLLSNYTDILADEFSNILILI